MRKKKVPVFGVVFFVFCWPIILMGKHQTGMFLKELAIAEKESGLNAPHTVVFLPILKALNSFVSSFGENESYCWQSSHPIIQAIRKQVYDGCKPAQVEDRFGLGEFSRDELFAKASSDFDDLNSHLKASGLDILLKPGGSLPVGVISILDILGEWKTQGVIADPVKYEGKEFPAFKVRGRGVEVIKLESQPNPVIVLDTKSGDIVYITIPDKEYGGFALLEYAAGLMDSSWFIADEYEGAVIPKVNLNEAGEISYLFGASLLTDHPEYIIESGVQQNKFAMNKEGVKTQSTSAGKVDVKDVEVPQVKPYYIVDKPFVVVIERPGMDIPFFAAYVTPTFWQHPGSFKK